MKKILVAILVLSFLAVPAMNAQSRQLKKAQKKEYKMKLKEYKKGGWIVFGTSHTLEVALLTHYEKLRQDGISELVVTTTSTNKNIAKTTLLIKLYYSNSMRRKPPRTQHKPARPCAYS